MEARTQTSLPAVTDRQLEVAALIARGLDNPAIARELGISLAGAKYHVSELLARLNLGSRDEVARWYRGHQRGGTFRRFGLAPLGWALGGLAGAAIAATAVAVFALGGAVGEESVEAPAPTAAVVSQPTGNGGFIATGSPTTPTRAQFTTSLLEDGRVLLAGGATLDGARTTELYDPANGTFSPGPETAEGRRAHAAVRLADGRVLLAGGMSLEGALVLRSTEVYDPNDGAFHSAASMTDPRWDAAAVLLQDGRVLVSGGVIENLEDGSPVLSDRAELYDPVTDAFAATGSMHSARRSHHLTLLEDGRVLVTGGGPLEVYDPTTGEFTLLGGEPVVDNEPAVATRLADGRVLITGVYDDPEARRRGDSNRATAAYLVDPTSGTIDRTGDLTTGRSGYHTATLLPDGRVLIAGGSSGYGQQTVYPPEEIFDPATGLFEVIASTEDGQTPSGLRATNVATHLAGHTATRLSDGSVLMIGSTRTATAPALVAERFDPIKQDAGDRFAEAGRNSPIPVPTPGRALSTDYTGFLGSGGTPLNASTFVAAVEALGVQLRELPSGLGMCGAGAEGRIGLGIRATRVDGNPGAEDFALYVYSSPEALAAHWITDEAGAVRTNPGSDCDDAWGQGTMSWELGGLLINGNQLLIFDVPSSTFEQHDPDLRARLIEAFESMQP